MTIAISGLGFVGSSIIKSFNIKNIPITNSNESETINIKILFFKN